MCSLNLEKVLLKREGTQLIVLNYSSMNFHQKLMEGWRKNWRKNSQERSLTLLRPKLSIFDGSKAGRPLLTDTVCQSLSACCCWGRPPLEPLEPWPSLDLEEAWMIFICASIFFWASWSLASWWICAIVFGLLSSLLGTQWHCDGIKEQK